MGAVLRHHAVVLGGIVVATITSIRSYKYAVRYANGSVVWWTKLETALDELDRQQNGRPRLVGVIETPHLLTPGERYPSRPVRPSTGDPIADLGLTAQQLRELLEETWRRS